MLAGAVSAWFIYQVRPDVADTARQRFALVYDILERKYGFDDFYQAFFAGGSRRIGRELWKYGDAGVIDGLLVNGTAATIGWFASVFRRIQSGYLYHYAFAMIIGLLGLLTWAIVR
jgi:NADH-quinone oxidoreductase subunit L